MLSQIIGKGKADFGVDPAARFPDEERKLACGIAGVGWRISVLARMSRNQHPIRGAYLNGCGIERADELLLCEAGGR